MASKLSNTSLGVLHTLAWMLSSISVLVLNKEIYSAGFRYPFFVTGTGQVFSCFGTLLMVRLSILSMPPSPLRPQVIIRQVLPVVAAFSASLFFGNYASVYLSIAFVQMLKAFTPAITLMLCLMAGVEHFSLPVMASMLLIGFGTGSTILVEQAAPSFHLLGFLAFLLSALGEASKTVSSQVLLSSQHFTPAHAMIYIGSLTSAILLLGCLLFEAHSLMSGGYLLILRYPSLFLVSFLCSFLTNLFNYFAVKYTSSVTTKVAGCVKNIGAALYGVAMHGEAITGMQVVGYVISMFGVALYSWHKATANKQPAGKLKKQL